MTIAEIAISAILVILIIAATHKIKELNQHEKHFEDWRRFWNLPESFSYKNFGKLESSDLLFGKNPELPFEPWMAYGIEMNFITMTCLSHDGIPITPYEYTLLQGTHAQWICDRVDGQMETEIDDHNPDHLPCLYFARINGTDGSLLTFGTENLDQFMEGN